MGAPEVEDAAGGGEGIVLKIQASGFHSRIHTYLVDKPSLVKEQCFISDQARIRLFSVIRIAKPRSDPSGRQGRPDPCR